jgi:hypothetical protein
MRGCQRGDVIDLKYDGCTKHSALRPLKKNLQPEFTGKAGRKSWRVCPEINADRLSASRSSSQLILS